LTDVARAAVLGKPIGHSLSPTLHRAAYRALGLTDWQYDAIECAEADLAGLLAASPPHTVGYSCTMPLKREVLRVADSVTDEANAIGAGNTLLRDGSGWRADNTDWIGVRDALASRAVSATGSVVLLGAGGTAQAALAVLRQAEQVTILVRDPSRTDDLKATAQRMGSTVRFGLLSDPWPLDTADLVISTLPSGAADRVAEHPWRAEQALLDVVYHPWPTALASALAAAGGTVVSGASMLLYQAARQVELMTGRVAPVAVMRAALLAVDPECGA
jgi:shikimate dehydrogenase